MGEEEQGQRKAAFPGERERLMLTLFSGDWMEILALSENLQLPKEKLDRVMSTLQRWSFLDCRINLDKEDLTKKPTLKQIGESVLMNALATTRPASDA